MMNKKIFFCICSVLIALSPSLGVSQDGSGGSGEAIFEVQDNSEFVKPVKDEGNLRMRLAGISARIGGIQEALLEVKGEMQERDHLFGKKVDARIRKGTTGLSRKVDSLQLKLKSLEAEFLVVQGVVSENSERILRLEQYTGFEPSAKMGRTGNTAQTPRKEMTEEELYLNAKSLLDQGNLKESKEWFDRFLLKFPGSDKADNAQFWIGEIYYRDRWYEKAILEYQKVIEKYATGNKVLAAYLKQGIAFEKLGENANARLRYKELIKKFPGTQEAELAKKRLE